jgi:hypothetical protein
MKRGHQSTKKSKNYKIYVSGIPPGTGIQVVAGYFSSFGSGVSLLGSQVGSAALIGPPELSYGDSGPTKNFCVVQCQDRSTFCFILSMDHFFEDGSRFYCEPYKQGLPLIIKNNNTNKRRCFIRKVPSYVSQVELGRFLAELVGPVESVIRYQNKSQHQYPAKHCSFSATFFDQATLAFLLRLQETEEGIKIYKEKLIIEKYDIKKANGKPRQPPQKQLISSKIGVLKSTADPVPLKKGLSHNQSTKKDVQNAAGIRQQSTIACRQADVYDISRLMMKPNCSRYHTPSDKSQNNTHATANLRMNVLLSGLNKIGN